MTTKTTDRPPSGASRSERDLRAIHLAGFVLVTAVSVERRLARRLRAQACNPHPYQQLR
jgi:hypothetical protein